MNISSQATYNLWLGKEVFQYYTCGKFHCQSNYSIEWTGQKATIKQEGWYNAAGTAAFLPCPCPKSAIRSIYFQNMKFQMPLELATPSCLLCVTAGGTSYLSEYILDRSMLPSIPTQVLDVYSRSVFTSLVRFWMKRVLIQADEVLCSSQCHRVEINGTNATFSVLAYLLVANLPLWHWTLLYQFRSATSAKLHLRWEHCK